MVCGWTASLLCAEACPLVCRGRGSAVGTEARHTEPDVADRAGLLRRIPSVDIVLVLLAVLGGERPSHQGLLEQRVEASGARVLTGQTLERHAVITPSGVRRCRRRRTSQRRLIEIPDRLASATARAAELVHVDEVGAGVGVQVHPTDVGLLGPAGRPTAGAQVPRLLARCL